jgi:hypothetical protein
VPGDEFGERGFTAGFGIFAQELGIGLWLHLPIKYPGRRKSDKVFRTI